MKRIILLTAVIAVLFASCSNPSEDSEYTQEQTTQEVTQSETQSDKFWYPTKITTLWSYNQCPQTMSYGQALNYYGVSELEGYNNYKYTMNWPNENGMVAPGHYIYEYPARAIIIFQSENKMVLRWIGDADNRKMIPTIMEGTFEYK